MKMMVMATMIAVSEGSIDYMGYQPRPTLMTVRTSGGWICRREEWGKGRRRSGLYVTSNNQIAINSSSTERKGGMGGKSYRTPGGICWAQRWWGGGGLGSKWGQLEYLCESESRGVAEMGRKRGVES